MTGTTGAAEAIAEGTGLDVIEASRRWQERHTAALPYLARARSEGGSSVELLVAPARA